MYVRRTPEVAKGRDGRAKPVLQFGMPVYENLSGFTLSMSRHAINGTERLMYGWICNGHSPSGPGFRLHAKRYSRNQVQRTQAQPLQKPTLCSVCF